MGIFKRKKKEVACCPNCRKEVPDGTVFCESCGLRQLPPPACAKCGIPLAPDTNFCESCGTPVGPVLPGLSTQNEENDGCAAPGPALPKQTRKGKKKRRKGSQKPEELPQDGAAAPGPVAAGLPGPAPGQEDANSCPGIPPPVPAPGSGRFFRAHPVLAAMICLLLAGVVLAFFVVPGMIPLFSHNGSAGAPGSVPVPVLPAPSDVHDIASLNPSDQQKVPGPSLVPRPTVIPPESYSVWFQAVRDPVTHNVTVLFDGGKGQRGVRDVLVRLTRSDGRVLAAGFRPVAIGDGVTLPGTKYTDRLEVVVTYNSGEQFPVIDKLFEHKERT